MINIFHKTFIVSSMLLLCSSVVAESLFDDNSYKPVTVDHRARNVGDILTVLIYEEAKATTSTATDASKKEKVSLSTNGGQKSKNRSLGVSSDFDGGGSLNRTGQFVARVSVVVVEVFENGDLLITGNQKIEFNNETQNITIKGRVRAQDLTNTNTVISTRLAEAEIKYMGEGLLTNRQKPGIITRFFNWLF